MTIQYHRTYSSAGDWYDQCNRDTNAPCVTDTNDSQIEHAFGKHDHSQMEWSGTRLRRDAMALAGEGWKEGRDKIATALSAARPFLRPALVRSRALDLGGAYPFIPAAVAGDPLCMWTVGDEERATKPIVRLVAEQWGSAGISRDELMRRGAALLAHIDRLESADIRCEVIVRYSASNCESGKIDGKAYRPQSLNYVVDIVAKRAEEPLEIDRLAFLLVHPSALRRLYFGSMWTLPEGADMWTSHHGMPPTKSAREVEHDQILIPTANEWTADYKNDATAVSRVESFIVDGIKKMSDSGFRTDLGHILEKDAA